MMDLRPVGYVIGLMVAALGVTMVLPFGLELWLGARNGGAFLMAMVLTVLTGGLIALACASAVSERLSLRQTFLITTSVWLALPIFGALPFMFGALADGHALSLTDAFFEAMSGLTTTGSTVIVGIDEMSEGLKLWRAILQWLGGVGIIVVAMVFLPELKVGGMQIFRTESFDTMGKILPRATQIATRISVIYAGLTGICALAYGATGMSAFDAICHAMTTIATGGFANFDRSFSDLGAGAEYVASVFMLLAALPFVRYVQLLAGSAQPLFRDRQIIAFFGTVFVIVLLLTLWLTLRQGAFTEEAFRKVLFNGVSILTGTGYASADYMLWGSFAVTLMFFVGLIGGCAGSTSCSIKIFRYQLFFASVRAQVNAIHSPHGVFTPRYDGRPIGEDVMNSVMAFFVFFIATLTIVAVILGMTGLDFTTSVSGAAAALANIGPGLGEIIGPTGSFEPLSDLAKWVLAIAMFVGRLEVMAVFAILTWQFWRE